MNQNIPSSSEFIVLNNIGLNSKKMKDEMFGKPSYGDIKAEAHKVG